MLAVLLLVVSLSACVRKADSDRPLLVATTGIIGDVVGTIGGPDFEVLTLIPAGTDPHEYAPSARQVAAISGAEHVFANGLGLEEGLIDLLEQAESEGLQVSYLAEEADPIDGDPHFWQDPVRMSQAAALIATALGATDDFQATLEELNRDVEKLVSVIPEERRLLVTSHNFLAYFADRYGFEVVGTIIANPSASPSSAELAELVAIIEEQAIPAIFVENTGSDDLAGSIGEETGAELVELASDALGDPGSETGTYVDMMRFNARAIAAALGG